MALASLSGLAFPAALSLLLVACGGGAAAPRVIGPVPSASPTSAAPVPVPAAPPATPAPPDVRAPDPEARRFFLAHLASPPVAPSATPPSKVAQMALAATVLGEVGDKAVPAEPLTSATLTEGQRLVVPVTIAPGGCASFIAQGGLGTIEVDLFLTEGQADPPRIAGEDLRLGPVAVIGGSRGCVAPGGPFTGELHAVLRRGAGAVLVRGFRRP